jgi:hypothetical protein
MRIIITKLESTEIKKSVTLLIPKSQINYLRNWFKNDLRPKREKRLMLFRLIRYQMFDGISLSFDEIIEILNKITKTK